jgi:adenylate cyclase
LTLATLTAHRKIIDNLIRQRHGRFVNSAGGSVLAEFASVVEAVNCAVDIQTTLKAENAKLPPERRMEFRIGVNLGDGIGRGRSDSPRTQLDSSAAQKCHPRRVAIF